MKDIKNILRERILVLDGALGTMIQKYGFREEDFRGREFLRHPESLSGFNDLLNLTKPSSIKEIHTRYLESGANIITTNTFNSNSISMRDYGLDKIEGLVGRLNREGAALAKKSIAEFEASRGEIGLHFVGGSIGPTNRSASLSPDIADPLRRNVSYDELYEAFRQQIEGLIEGGVDLLIFETFFDTLNLKAALNAANNVLREKDRKIPLMVSATISDNAGRILSGQTIEAFVISVEHFDNLEIIGLNCGFGPDRMKSYISDLDKKNYHFSSCHPNAGLPDESGCYDIDAKEFVDTIKTLLEKRDLNIIGGCCGTTPEFIKKLSEIVKNEQPRIPQKENKILKLSGLEGLECDEGFILIGERCNVAGSAKFLRLIKEGNYEEAAEIAKSQIYKGASIVDINMDDSLLDAEKEMVGFVRYLLAEPEVAKVPFMIDSSKWNVIETTLKEIQGKGIVNSLSLKEGEEIFKTRAKRVRDLGFALVVMAFDEKGQADTFERKIEICKRAYTILTEQCGYHPEDIIFDVNVMTIGTGMKEHSRYAIDFIKAVEWIKKNLPGARTSGGVSNLSFAFRGKNKIREYMHVVFLHHAKAAGLDMAIINPNQKTGYSDVPPEIRETIEDIIFDRNPETIERLIGFAEEESKEKTGKEKTVETQEKVYNPDEALMQALIKGEIKDLETHIEKALQITSDPVKIIEGPLLAGMKRVGDLFGEGKMFLPQVVKTARIMKKAVDILTPYILKSQKGAEKKAGKILIATVKGDVHDIGKNIVSTVLGCNNYEIIDLGIMVSQEKIVEAALKEKPDIICLSGLITPSLSEMTETVKQLEAAGIRVPVMVGGAATSALHTALKIAPFYSGVVLHATDASQNPISASKLLNPSTVKEYVAEINKRHEESRNSYTKKSNVPFAEVLEIVKKQNRNDFKMAAPFHELGKSNIIDISLEDIIPYINWKMYFMAWRVQGKYLEYFSKLTDGQTSKESIQELETRLRAIEDEKEREKGLEAFQLYKNAIDILEKIRKEGKYDGKGMIRFDEARADEKNIYIGDQNFPMLRQQQEGSSFLSCSDYVGESNSYVGLFAVTAGRHMATLIEEAENNNDPYTSILLQTLADRLADASSEWLHNHVNSKYWDITIKPAWGYPMLPDQSLIFKAQSLLPLEQIGIRLTENGAMQPAASVSGLYFNCKNARYFMVGQIGEDQLSDYSVRCGETPEKIKERLRYI